MTLRLGHYCSDGTSSISVTPAPPDVCPPLNLSPKCCNQKYECEWPETYIIISSRNTNTNKSLLRIQIPDSPKVQNKYKHASSTKNVTMCQSLFLRKWFSSPNSVTLWNTFENVCYTLDSSGTLEQWECYNSLVKKCSGTDIWKGLLHLKSVIIAALTNLLFVRPRICISSGRNHLSSAGCVDHLVAIIIIITIINKRADIFIVSYPSWLAFSFTLGPPHWSSFPTSREHRKRCGPS